MKEHFGLAGALDYLIGEKLLTVTEVAELRAEFMQPARFSPGNSRCV